MRIPKFLGKTNARQRTGFGVLCAAIAWFGLRHHVRGSTAVVASWDVFAIVVLALLWTSMMLTPQHAIRRRAQAQDLSRFLSFVFVVVASCAALFAVAFLLRIHKDDWRAHLTIHLLLGLGTVVFSWLLVHSGFAVHYAHAFYGDLKEANQQQQREHAGGLMFPGSRLPDYFDFAYFSFVIGMTCQVSDVQISSHRIRRIALVHGVLSFGFNTIILAMLINTVTSLI